MSVNYYCKVVSKSKSEVIARVSCSLSVRDYLVDGNYQLDNLSKEAIKTIPKFIANANEREYFLGIADAKDFLHGTLQDLESKKKEHQDKLRELNLCILASKTKAVVNEFKSEIGFEKFSIDQLEDQIIGFSNLETIVDYELNSRIFYKNNKAVERDKQYVYRCIDDYDLYFFWN